MPQRALFLTTPRLVLRPFENADLDAAAALLCHDRVKATYVLPDFTSPAEAAPLFTRLCGLSRQTDRVVYAIALEGVVIGLINDVGIDGTALELGYAIHPDHWGHGYATEALTAVIAELFRAGYDRICAGYFTGNNASRRVMEKSGMVPIDIRQTLDYRGQTREVRYLGIAKD